MAGKLMDRWLKRKAPDDVSNQGPVSNANTSHEPHQQETNVRVSAREESIGRRRSNLHPVRLIVYLAYKAAGDVLL